MRNFPDRDRFQATALIVGMSAIAFAQAVGSPKRPANEVEDMEQVCAEQVSAEVPVQPAQTAPEALQGEVRFSIREWERVFSIIPDDNERPPEFINNKYETSSEENFGGSGFRKKEPFLPPRCRRRTRRDTVLRDFASDGKPPVPPNIPPSLPIRGDTMKISSPWPKPLSFRRRNASL